MVSGASKAAASNEMNLLLRTLQRWTVEGEIRADARSTTVRPVPANALTPAERQAILFL